MDKFKLLFKKQLKLHVIRCEENKKNSFTLELGFSFNKTTEWTAEKYSSYVRLSYLHHKKELLMEI